MTPSTRVFALSTIQSVYVVWLFVGIIVTRVSIKLFSLPGAKAKFYSSFTLASHAQHATFLALGTRDSHISVSNAQ